MINSLSDSFRRWPRIIVLRWPYPVRRTAMWVLLAAVVVAVELLVFWRPGDLAAVNAQQDPRKRQLAAIHAAKRTAGLDDEAYRDVLHRVTGRRSSKDMTAEERSRALGELNRLGGRPPGLVNRGHPGPRAANKWQAKARALWVSLYWLGVVGSRDDGALAAFVKRTAGVDRPEWLAAKSGSKVIEGLKAWAAREAGVDWEEAGDPRVCVLRAQWRRLAAIGQVRIADPDGLDAWLQGRVAPHKTGVSNMTAKQADTAMVLLGRWLRRGLTPKEPTNA